MQRWYVAQTLPGLELTAERNLIRNGLEAEDLCSTRRVFPGYLFIRLLAAGEAALVNRTRGILKMLPRHAESPLPLPDGFVDDLRRRLKDGDLSPLGEEQFLMRWLPGDLVSATAGPFRDQRGRFLRYGKECAVVLGYLLGCECEYKIPLAQITAAAA